ncbi:MAG: SsrA-binding protein, partial [Candidatus Omnitrophica bacterium]|nr:SsrA-binding protein [Candidatus Omnitrophota bacterium]
WLTGLMSVRGHALVPLSFYWKNRKVKVGLALAKGKSQFDKRDDIKQREADRDLRRASMHWIKSK